MENTTIANDFRTTTAQRSDDFSTTQNNHVKHISQSTIAKELERLNVPEITGIELISEGAEKMDWLLENLMPKIGMGALAGGSDIGKSTELRQLAIDIVSGSETHLGFKIQSRFNSVIMVCTEDDRTAVAFLLKKTVTAQQTPKMKDLRFIFDYEDLLLQLDSRLTAKPADMVIIDCFADSFGGDLKDTQKIRIFLSGYQQLAAKHGCFILFLHHTGKRTESLEPSKNNLLSGQGFEAKMRLVMELRADPYNSAFRHLCIVKGNYLPASMKRESFVLKFDENNFTFTNTGERTPFELLVKQSEDGSKAKYELAKELQAKGYNYDTIAKHLGYESKGSVSKLFAKGEKSGWK